MTSLRRAFLDVYGFDGFNPIDGKITFMHCDEPLKVKKSKISNWILIASFFGLPSRPFDLDVNRNVVAELNLSSLMINFIGGWFPVVDSFYIWRNGSYVLNERVIWQLIALPVKLLIILPLKILVIPVKFMINILKLFTEFLPRVILIPLFMFLLNKAFSLITLIPTFFLGIILSVACLVNFLPVKILFGLIAIIILLPLIALMIVNAISVFAVSLAFTIIRFVLEATTSPEKAARRAFNYGWQKLGIVGGVVFATFTVGISAVAWAIALPVLIGGILGIFPGLMQMVTWVAHIPGVSAIHGILTTIGQALSTLLAPLISLISTFLSVNITGPVLTMGTALGMLFAPIGAILSRVADELSDRWAGWFDGGPVTWIGSCATSNTKKMPVEGLHNPSLKSVAPKLKPANMVQKLAGSRSRALDNSEKSVNQVENTAHALTIPSYSFSSNTSQISNPTPSADDLAKLFGSTTNSGYGLSSE